MASILCHTWGGILKTLVIFRVSFFVSSEDMRALTYLSVF